MKSTLQEASTIAKAVEQGWREAGEPSEFSVKILELPLRNFIGLTTRSAKIAFMFNGMSQKTQEPGQKTHATTPPKPYTPREKKEFTSTPRQPQPSSYEKSLVEKVAVQHSAPVAQKPASSFTKPAYETQKPVHEAFASSHNKTSEESPADAFGQELEIRKRPEGLWNEEIAIFSRDWLTKVFIHMDRPDITFTIEPQSFYLRITLSSPVFIDEGQEKHLLASLSSLMFATIKKHFRKALRGHKIVLTHVKN